MAFPLNLVIIIITIILWLNHHHNHDNTSISLSDTASPLNLIIKASSRLSMKPFPSCIKDNIDGGGGDNDGDGSDDDGGVIKYGAQFGAVWGAWERLKSLNLLDEQFSLNWTERTYRVRAEYMRSKCPFCWWYTRNCSEFTHNVFLIHKLIHWNDTVNIWKITLAAVRMILYAWYICFGGWMNSQRPVRR